MSWIKKLRAWWCGSLPAGSPAEDQEIDEELMSHLRLLVDDNLARGMPADTAWQEAQRRFGSLRRYADACRSGGASVFSLACAGGGVVLGGPRLRLVVS